MEVHRDLKVCPSFGKSFLLVPQWPPRRSPSLEFPYHELLTQLLPSQWSKPKSDLVFGQEIF
jgi:hypothetical protein